jgi:hypothetical protein
VTQAAAEFKRAQTYVNQGNPSSADFVSFDRAQKAVAAARLALQHARQQAFETAWTALALDGISALRERVEIGRIPGALTLSSPEPLLWERITLATQRSGILPLRRREIRFGTDFGAPDIGKFDYQGLSWNTNLELAVANQAVQPRLTDPWGLTVQLNGARSLEMDIRVAVGGSATLHGQGSGVAADATANGGTQGQSLTLTLTATRLNSVVLSGTGLSLVAVRYSQAFTPTLPSGPYGY